MAGSEWSSKFEVIIDIASSVFSSDAEFLGFSGLFHDLEVDVVFVFCGQRLSLLHIDGGFLLNSELVGPVEELDGVGDAVFVVHLGKEFVMFFVNLQLERVLVLGE